MANKDSIELYSELHRLGRQLHRIAHREWSEHGRYREVSRLLGLIAENDGIIQRDLAFEMDMRPSSMTEMLAHFEHMGLICREPDEKDQRVAHIRLTPEGKKMAGESTGATADLVDEMFKGMSEEEIASMLALARKLGANLDAMAPARGPCGGHFGRHREFGDAGGFHHHGCWEGHRFD